ncbi:MAG: protein-disulfide reductase DsbD domain-containing protein, partial [Pseudomonadota bacterium]|nr:protein-disulfide reductase DsbD domain-containing protein [Pseudomonadota bacterium]
AFFASLLAIFPALAGMTTPWIKRDVIEARLVLARDAKQHFAGVEIVMQPGWRTYWRYPGASGIAPSFDFSASQNLKTQDPVFPAPYFFDDGAGGFFGYEGLTGFVVPFLLENAGEGGQVSLNLELGVCREVCLPVQFSFDLPVMPGPLKTPDELDIIQAMLDAGPVAPSAELGIDTLSYDGAALQFVVVGTNLENPQIMAIPGPNDVFGTPHISARHPSSFLIEMPAWSVLDQTMIGRIVEVIVRDGERAVFQKIQIGDHRVLGK